MNKKILTIKKIMENMTYDATNICYENKPIFRVTEEGLTYKEYKFVESGKQDSTILTTLCQEYGYDNIECYDENGNHIRKIHTHTDNSGLEYYTIDDDSYWKLHNKIKIWFFYAEDNDEFEEYYTKEEFYCKLPKYDYRVISVVDKTDNILKNKNLLFVETDNEYIAVETCQLHLLLNHLK